MLELPSHCLQAQSGCGCAKRKGVTGTDLTTICPLGTHHHIFNTSATIQCASCVPAHTFLNGCVTPALVDRHFDIISERLVSR